MSEQNIIGVDLFNSRGFAEKIGMGKRRYKTIDNLQKTGFLGYTQIGQTRYSSLADWNDFCATQHSQRRVRSTKTVKEIGAKVRDIRSLRKIA